MRFLKIFQRMQIAIVKCLKQKNISTLQRNDRITIINLKHQKILINIFFIKGVIVYVMNDLKVKEIVKCCIFYRVNGSKKFIITQNRLQIPHFYMNDRILELYFHRNKIKTVLRYDLSHFRRSPSTIFYQRMI